MRKIFDWFIILTMATAATMLRFDNTVIKPKDAFIIGLVLFIAIYIKLLDIEKQNKK